MSQTYQLELYIILFILHYSYLIFIYPSLTQYCPALLTIIFFTWAEVRWSGLFQQSCLYFCSSQLSSQNFFLQENKQSWRLERRRSAPIGALKCNFSPFSEISIDRRTNQPSDMRVLREVAIRIGHSNNLRGFSRACGSYLTPSNDRNKARQRVPFHNVYKGTVPFVAPFFCVILGFGSYNRPET